MNDTTKVETRHCSGCGQDKPWSQFEVREQNPDGTAWTRTRKWCHACCDALFKKREESNRQWVQATLSQRAEDEKRKRSLGTLPAWCDRDAVDYLVNAGKPSVLGAVGIGVSGISERHGYVARARHMDLLWRAFGKHEREIGESLGGRGNRFICAMTGILQAGIL